MKVLFQNEEVYLVAIYNLVLVFHIKNLKSNYEFCSYLSCKSVLVLYCEVFLA